MNVIEKILGKSIKRSDVWSKNIFVTPIRKKRYGGVIPPPVPGRDDGEFYWKDTGKLRYDEEGNPVYNRRGEQKTIHIPIPTRSIGPKAVRMDDAVNIASAPWATKEEKIQQLRKMGASDSMINMAFRKSSDKKVRIHGRMR